MDTEGRIPPPPGRRIRGRRQTGEAESEPAVRVTIGRIEVRSVSPAPPPAPRRRPEPRLSLEDYLRQRREGRR